MTDDKDAFPLLRNRLKELLAAGDVAICLRTTLTATNEVAFLAQAAGFDALYVDLEHSTALLRDAAQVCSTAAALGVTPLVRLRSGDDDAAVPLLDAGCQGVIAPHVSSAAQASRLVDRCLFPPLGHRSPAGPALQLGYRSIPPTDAASRLNRGTLICVMVESEEGVADIKQIAGVPGVDLILVGTQDLSNDMGIAGDVDSPRIHAVYQRVAAACAATGTAFGVAGISDTETISRYVGFGAQFISAGRDADFLRTAATARVLELRAIPAR